MSVQNAIEVLEVANRDFDHTAASDLHEAIQLAIIVLKTRTHQEVLLIDAIMALDPD